MRFSTNALARRGRAGSLAFEVPLVATAPEKLAWPARGVVDLLRFNKRSKALDHDQIQLQFTHDTLTDSDHDRNPPERPHFRLRGSEIFDPHDRCSRWLEREPGGVRDPRRARREPAAGRAQPELEITDRALRAWFGHRYEGSGRWFLEGREPNRVLAGYQRRDYYIRVAVIYSATTVEFVVDESRDLRETETYIHKSAVRWIQDLEIRIRRYLGQVALS